MLINHHNYETYFLLYADGELDATGMRQVDAFVAQQPHLGTELDLLLHSKLECPQSTQMPNKHLLVKALPWDAEHLTPAQFHMLLQLDGELHTTHAEPLRQLVATDAEALCDWNSLSTAQLDATEMVEMPNKHLLYRQKEETKPLYWLRPLAKAAAVVGLGWFALTRFTQSPIEPEKQSTAGITTQKNATPVVKTDSVSLNLQKPTLNPNYDVANTQQASDTATLPLRMPSASQQALAQQALAQQTTVPPEQEAVAQPAERMLAQLSKVTPVTSVTKNTTAFDATVSENATRLTTVEPAVQPTNNLAVAAVYNEEPGSEDEYVYISGARIEKQKLRGVFRKVGRTIGRTMEKHSIAQVVTEGGLQR
jgi:hypothetical protein